MSIFSLTLLSTLTSLTTAAPLLSPSSVLGPVASWKLEGFAKENPLGPTTGGLGGETIQVNTTSAFLAAIKGDTPRTIILSGNLNFTSRPKIGSNKSILGTTSHKIPPAHITGAGLDIVNSTNIIIRNLKISYILDNDCITIRNSTRVWIDHNEFTSDISQGPDEYDGQVDIIRGSDWITVSWNYFHDHWKSSLVGNDATFRDIDSGHLHVTYHHNYWRNEGTRGPAGRFGHQHVYNNLYEDFLYQAIHSRSDNQVLVEGNVFRGDTREALSTYGLVIPDDSPNTCVCGDEELDGFANLGAKNDWGGAGVNITHVGNFTRAPYKYRLTPLFLVAPVVKLGAGVGKI
ncbi:polysaccharide lyase [Naviculisporaceae sp. PSN 640]